VKEWLERGPEIDARHRLTIRGFKLLLTARWARAAPLCFNPTPTLRKRKVSSPLQRQRFMN
jgi:hypothetical protein